ncbi:MAG: hypothetical protein KF687_01765 [Cyclobacteriaceae bacterium]|nr:hypothetical protein [Cyclobacteriaceae bacterium]
MKRIIWVLIIVFILMNVVAIFHAYKFTHFAEQKVEKTKDAKTLTPGQKITTLLVGVSNPRPENKAFPTGDYETIKLSSNREIECWSIKVENPKGTIIVFHGFSGEKSS